MSYVLQVKAGMCAAHMGDKSTAFEQLATLQLESPADYGDLYLEVGDLLLSLEEYSRVRLDKRTHFAPYFNAEHLHWCITAFVCHMFVPAEEALLVLRHCHSMRRCMCSLNTATQSSGARWLSASELLAMTMALLRSTSGS